MTLNNLNVTNNPTDMSNQINDLLKMAAEKISCGPDCQKQKESSSLYQTYLNAQTNYLNAPEQISVAEKNYYVKTYGVAAYNDLNKEQLTATADIIIEKLSEKFNQQISDAQSFNKLYNTDWINAQNTIELHNYYKNENNKLVSNVTGVTADVYTNNRRSYYENQELQGLEWWYIIESWIYTLVVLIFAVFSLFGTSSRSRMVLFISFIVMIMYPFVSTYIVLAILSFIKWMFSFFPKNVYLDNI